MTNNEFDLDIQLTNESTFPEPPHNDVWGTDASFCPVTDCNTCGDTACCPPDTDCPCPGYSEPQRTQCTTFNC